MRFGARLPSVQVYGLVGSPVEGSLSPPIHEAAYRELGLDARYVLLEPASGELRAAIAGADALGMAGLNVTVPYKERVADLDVVQTDDLAGQIGAVNTLEFGDDGVTGHNTDATGARRALREAGADPSATAVVVGAGGAGRAVTVGLAAAGAKIRVANRTVDRARDLADRVPEATAHGLDALPDLVGDARVLVNATTVGSDGESSPVPAEALHDELTVLDAVYRPVETPLLREAADRGARTVPGTRMLLYQAVEALERWIDRPAPTDAMDAALRERV